MVQLLDDIYVTPSKCYLDNSMLVLLLNSFKPWRRGGNTYLVNLWLISTSMVVSPHESIWIYFDGMCIWFTNPSFLKSCRASLWVQVNISTFVMILRVSLVFWKLPLISISYLILVYMSIWMCYEHLNILTCCKLVNIEIHCERVVYFVRIFTLNYCEDNIASCDGYICPQIITYLAACLTLTNS
jgi:hypothetical protein